jgi:hypothetical protein
MSYTKEHELEFPKASVTVEGTWKMEDASFDYAGTHCTGGRSGTQECYNIVLEEVVFVDASCPESGETLTLTSDEQESYTTKAKEMLEDNCKEAPCEVTIKEHYENERADAMYG